MYVASFVRYFIAVCLEILNLLTAYMLCNMYLVLTITFPVFLWSPYVIGQTMNY